MQEDFAELSGKMIENHGIIVLDFENRNKSGNFAVTIHIDSAS